MNTIHRAILKADERCLHSTKQQQSTKQDKTQKICVSGIGRLS